MKDPIGKAYLIKGGFVMDPANDREGKADILIADGLVAGVENEIDEAALRGEYKNAEKLSGQKISLEVIDATGLYVTPGFVDVHSHFRDPGFTEKEDIYSGAKAAAAGGYTSVILMANTKPAIDNEEQFKLVQKRCDAQDIHVYQAAAVTLNRAGEKLVDMEALVKAGVKGFTDDGSPIMDGQLVISAMKEASELKVPLSFHEEDSSYIGVAGVNEGEASGRLGIKGADREAEIVMVKRDLELALKYDCKIDIQHVSAKESVELIRKAKKKDKKGLIHAEATPNHFSLTEAAVEKYGTNAKINPPLRTEEDRQAIVEGLADGTIDMIATDHAPHTKKEKEADEFGKAPSGILGLETALSLSVKNLIQPGKLSVSEFVKRISLSPAELYSLEAGRIDIGRPADITIFSIDEETVYKKFNSKSENSPFLGEKLPGKVKYTIAGGVIVYKA